MCLHNCKNCKNFRVFCYSLRTGEEKIECCSLTHYAVSSWLKKYIYCKDWERKDK